MLRLAAMVRLLTIAHFSHIPLPALASVKYPTLASAAGPRKQRDVRNADQRVSDSATSWPRNRKCARTKYPAYVGFPTDNQDWYVVFDNRRNYMIPRTAARKNRNFDPDAFLATIGAGRKILSFSKKQAIFAQGDSTDAVFYIREGKVRLSVVSSNGKEATIGILGGGDFFGEGCLVGQPLRMGSAIAMTDCVVLRIDKKAMMQVLHREPALSDLFVAYLLARNIRYEEDLVDQLFNSSEKRLARILLLLARFGKEGAPETLVPKVSQETLAEMVGTTRSRISFFMNRFRKLGFVDYNGGLGLQVHSSLLNVILHD
jgi:CRP/FNR family transcriptional regulator, cyclic AMP receptor protein